MGCLTMMARLASFKLFGKLFLKPSALYGSLVGEDLEKKAQILVLLFIWAVLVLIVPLDFVKQLGETFCSYGLKRTENSVGFFMVQKVVNMWHVQIDDGLYNI